jgi:hypothetical protein
VARCLLAAEPRRLPIFFRHPDHFYAIAIALPPAFAWGAVSSAFHLWSQREFGGAQGPIGYLLQALVGLGYFWGPDAIALPVGIAGVACLVLACRMLDLNKREAQFLLAVCIFFALQLLLVCSVYIGDPLQGRFLWIFVLSVSPMLFLGPLNRFMGVIVFMFALGATAMTASRAAKWTIHRPAEAADVIGMADRISPEPKPGERLARGSVILVGPPRYPWETVADPQQPAGERQNR